MGEQEIKMWGKGGVQRSEPLEVPRCIFLRSNANFKSLFNFVELAVTNLTMVYDLWNKPMVSIATEEVKYERGHLPPPPFRLATLLVLNEVWALGTYEYFQAFAVGLEKICLTVSKCFMCALTNHLHIINFTEIRASFILHLWVILEKRNKLNCGGSYHFLSTWY